ncbi:MAG TPA: right-handed parallel beta-helix repeat-containing protein [Casimicrobiaceae bacterium]|nr:right-handed parallel beta-helix repeat-containing protein [Casimicrobiaceae bacterium]
MNVATSVRVGVVAAATLFSFAQPADAGLFRAYLSSTGSDANPCTVVAPCRLLPAALGAVNDGGEIWILDSANYNTSPVTISISVTILAIPGAVGSFVSTGSFTALAINGATTRVSLRNLSIVPLSDASTGIMFSGAELNIEDCRIAGMPNDGVDAIVSSPATVRIRNSVIRGSGQDGFYARGQVVAVLDAVHSESNHVGVYADAGSKVNVTNSVLAGNDVGAFSFAGRSGPTQLVVSHTTVSGNSSALLVGAGPGQDASLVSDENVLTFASDTVFAFDGAGGTETIWTRGNNTVGYYNQPITPGHSLTPLGVL